MKSVWLVWGFLGIICIFTALDTSSKINESVTTSKINALPLIEEQKLDIVIENVGIETIDNFSEPTVTVVPCEVTGTCTTPVVTTSNRFRIFRWRRR